MKPYYETKLKQYLSFGGGVNSVAMTLYCLDKGWNFENVFVDHGTDWPETYEYLETFQSWLFKNGHKPITVLRPRISGYQNLYDYCWHYKMVPSFMFRWCSDKFKVRSMLKYYKKPCISMIGFGINESKRAKPSDVKGVENKFPLIEAEMNREDCKKYIEKHGLPVPMKSGCFICPYQKVDGWVRLESKHPDLFQKAVQLEQRNMEYRKSIGKPILFLSQSKKIPLPVIIENERKQLKMF